MPLKYFPFEIYKSTWGGVPSYSFFKKETLFKINENGQFSDTDATYIYKTTTGEILYRKYSWYIIFKNIYNLKEAKLVIRQHFKQGLPNENI